MAGRLTATQSDVLVRALRCGGEVDFESFIASHDSDWNRTNFALTNVLRSLQKRGLVTIDTMLTDAGRWAAMLAWVATDLPAPVRS
jgi:hypothetical protein